MLRTAEFTVPTAAGVASSVGAAKCQVHTMDSVYAKNDDDFLKGLQSFTDWLSFNQRQRLPGMGTVPVSVILAKSLDLASPDLLEDLRSMSLYPPPTMKTSMPSSGARQPSNNTNSPANCDTDWLDSLPCLSTCSDPNRPESFISWPAKWPQPEPEPQPQQTSCESGPSRSTPFSKIPWWVNEPQPWTDPAVVQQAQMHASQQQSWASVSESARIGPVHGAAQQPEPHPPCATSVNLPWPWRQPQLTPAQQALAHVHASHMQSWTAVSGSACVDSSWRPVSIGTSQQPLPYLQQQLQHLFQQQHQRSQQRWHKPLPLHQQQHQSHQDPATYTPCLLGPVRCTMQEEEQDLLLEEIEATPWPSYSNVTSATYDAAAASANIRLVAAAAAAAGAGAGAGSTTAPGPASRCADTVAALSQAGAGCRTPQPSWYCGTGSAAAVAPLSASAPPASELLPPSPPDVASLVLPPVEDARAALPRVCEASAPKVETRAARRLQPGTSTFGPLAPSVPPRNMEASPFLGAGGSQWAAPTADPSAAPSCTVAPLALCAGTGFSPAGGSPGGDISAQRPLSVAAVSPPTALSDMSREDFDMSVNAGDGDTAAHFTSFPTAAGRATATESRGTGGVPFRRPGGRVTLEVLRSMFDRPVQEVLCALNISATDLKRRCRALGIQRWPHRKLKSLKRLAEALETDTELSEQERREMLERVVRNRAEILADPDAELEACLKPVRQQHYKRDFVGRRTGARA